MLILENQISGIYLGTLRLKLDSAHHNISNFTKLLGIFQRFFLFRFSGQSLMNFKHLEKKNLTSKLKLVKTTIGPINDLQNISSLDICLPKNVLKGSLGDAIILPLPMQLFRQMAGNYWPTWEVNRFIYLMYSMELQYF